MKILLKKATIIDPSSTHHNKTKDIFIQDGQIISIKNKIEAKADKVFERDHYFVSPGWLDIFSDFGEPGFEKKETLISGSKVATKGGYTDVFLIPNTNPTFDSRKIIEQINQHNQNQECAVHFYPLGNVTIGTQGEKLAEIYDLHNAGVVAFSDGIRNLHNDEILIKAFEYIKPTQKTILQFPYRINQIKNGVALESPHNYTLGLKTFPSILEEIAVWKDLQLAEYAQGSIHFTGISSLKSLEYIQKSKNKKRSLSCSVTPYNLSLSYDELDSNYNTHLKLLPPLRAKNEVEKLKEAFLNGTIDFIASHHLPQEIDTKDCDFEAASFGMISLQNCFAIVNTAIPQMPVERWVDAVSIKNRMFFNLEVPTIKENSNAKLTLFSNEEESILTHSTNSSLSVNTPFIDKKLKGKIYATLTKGKLNLNL